MNTHLDRKHELLLESLLAGSLPRNVHWSDVVGLIGKLGEIEPHGGTEFAFIVGSQRAFFKRPSTHTLEEREVPRLRGFLREADLSGSPKNQCNRHAALSSSITILEESTRMSMALRLKAKTLRGRMIRMDFIAT